MKLYGFTVQGEVTYTFTPKLFCFDFLTEVTLNIAF